MFFSPGGELISVLTPPAGRNDTKIFKKNIFFKFMFFKNITPRGERRELISVLSARRAE